MTIKYVSFQRGLKMQDNFIATKYCILFYRKKLKTLILQKLKIYLSIKLSTIFYDKIDIINC